jgi:hypothetical protein
MKKQAFRIITLLSLFCTLAVTTAYAQSADRISMKIPFSFIVGEKTLQAGEYIVRSTFSSRVILIRTANGRRVHTTILTMPVPPDNTPFTAKLVFHRYGSQYFLHQVWTPSSERGGQLSQSQAERAIAKELARGLSEHQLVTVVGQ